MEVADSPFVVAAAAAALDRTAPLLSEAELGNRRLEAADTGRTGAAVEPFAAAAVDIVPGDIAPAGAGRIAAGSEAVRGK